VTTKIGGFENRPAQVGGDRSVSKSRDSTSTPAGSVATSSPVQITDQARQLAALEQAVQSMPVVNEARVAEIRLAIEEGRYEVAPERIAEKLMRMDQDLRAAEK